MATFTYVNAIRDNLDVLEIEKIRQCSNHDADINGWKYDTEVFYPPAEALRFAIMYGNIDYTKYVLENFASEALSVMSCCPLLLLAVRLNQEKIVELICIYSQNVLTHLGRYYIDSFGCGFMESGKTALHTAVELGYRGCTRILLRYGADHRLRDSDNRTVLERGCYLFTSKPSMSVLSCILEIVHCERQLQPENVNMINDLCKNGQPPEYFNKLPLTLEISKLVHICRYVVREILQRKLPSAFSELDIPITVRDYLDVNYILPQS